jgi:hypothetical protein
MIATTISTIFAASGSPFASTYVMSPVHSRASCTVIRVLVAGPANEFAVIVLMKAIALGTVDIC